MHSLWRNLGPVVSIFLLVAPAHAGKVPKAQIHATFVPGLPDVKCSGPGAAASAPPCADTSFEVKVLPLVDATGQVLGCLTSFLYNDLKIVTGARKVEATVTWFIDPRAGARFAGDGIAITKGSSGPAPNALFDLPPTIDPSGLKVSVRSKPNIGHGKVFVHKPVVELNGQPCAGVDPTIGNSAS